jgi:hypothetical protein
MMNYFNYTSFTVFNKSFSPYDIPWFRISIGTTHLLGSQPKNAKFNYPRLGGEGFKIMVDLKSTQGSFPFYHSCACLLKAGAGIQSFLWNRNPVSYVSIGVGMSHWFAQEYRGSQMVSPLFLPVPHKWTQN